MKRGYRKAFVWSLAALFILALAVRFIPYVSEFIEIDACLDRGGRWNDAEHRCEWG